MKEARKTWGLIKTMCFGECAPPHDAQSFYGQLYVSHQVFESTISDRIFGYLSAKSIQSQLLYYFMSISQPSETSLPPIRKRAQHAADKDQLIFKPCHCSNCLWYQ